MYLSMPLCYALVVQSTSRPRYSRALALVTSVGISCPLSLYWLHS